MLASERWEGEYIVTCRTGEIILANDQIEFFARPGWHTAIIQCFLNIGIIVSVITRDFAQHGLQ